ncbi:Protein of unknown function [Aquiflexum balticum DSM 16537]|uniref:DUF1538 domain-containing protein n=1 Tax=Aquiflexum balticum DSM 16537 TaxID=758820 RepID=A0A1W2H7Q4_9BACT|nr:DUF1538 domain-containing protein [Aquiflexum balticum]SMD44943.1 Protein of unknown function [Aquiflexum balticum DSM 16537]
MFGTTLEFYEIFLLTIRDVAPVVLLVVLFQLFVLKQNLPNLRKVVIGVLLVIIGLALFLMGLEKALFPIGQIMAEQLSEPIFISKSYENPKSWVAYYWIYIFAAMIGFATTIAEPSLIAVAIKANQASGGTISTWGLRIVVAIGVAIALTLGTIRIVTGTPLYIYIIVGYIIVMIQTIFSPKRIIALAYDSGGVTTSTVTVPLVVALGIGLSSVVPGRNPAIDGFGLIAFASLFPIITVLGYAQITEFRNKIKKEKNEI